MKMNPQDKVEYKNQPAYIIELKLDKAKIQLLDSGGFSIKTDWVECSELKERTWLTSQEKSHSTYLENLQKTAFNNTCSKF